MAVPGNVLSGRNRGGHALIRDGAKTVEIGGRYPGGTWAGRGAAADPADGCSTPSQDVLRSARCGTEGARQTSTAAGRSSGLPARVLLPRLLELELTGPGAAACRGGRFIRCVAK